MRWEHLYFSSGYYTDSLGTTPAPKETTPLMEKEWHRICSAFHDGIYFTKKLRVPCNRLLQLGDLETGPTEYRLVKCKARVLSSELNTTISVCIIIAGFYLTHTVYTSTSSKSTTQTILSRCECFYFWDYEEMRFHSLPCTARLHTRQYGDTSVLGDPCTHSAGPCHSFCVLSPLLYSSVTMPLPSTATDSNSHQSLPSLSLVHRPMLPLPDNTVFTCLSPLLNS